MTFPGAVGISRLRVYTDAAPDGVRGGSPHLHTVCSEGYLVTAGHGSVQTITLAEGFRETPLEAGALLWFGPGTVHRLVNARGLELIVIMQNSGLPEAGDAVLTFPDEHLTSAAAYAVASSIEGDEWDARLRAAMRRRDRAAAGFNMLRHAVERGDLAPLERFHDRAAQLVAGNADHWRERWRKGAWNAAAATDAHLDAIAEADVSHFSTADVRTAAPVERLGMCGWLRAY